MDPWKRQIQMPLWGAALLAASGCAGWLLSVQLSRVLFSVVRESDYEAQRMVEGVTSAVQSDNTDIALPDEVAFEEPGVFSYGALQTIYLRQTPQGPCDWQWSFDKVAWNNTALVQDQAALLDPPNLIFICRLQLESAVRRKSCRTRDKLLGSGRAGSSYIPPPLKLAPAGGRSLIDAPDHLCCPITGGLMSQPVVAPSGKTFEFSSLCQWVLRHGTDPTTNQPLSVHDLYPNLVVREQIEEWLAGSGEAAAAAEAAAGASYSGSRSSSNRECGQCSSAGCHCEPGAGACCSGAAAEVADKSGHGRDPAGSAQVSLQAGGFGGQQQWVAHHSSNGSNGSNSGGSSLAGREQALSGGGRHLVGGTGGSVMVASLSH